MAYSVPEVAITRYLFTQGMVCKLGGAAVTWVFVRAQSQVLLEDASEPAFCQDPHHHFTSAVDSFTNMAPSLRIYMQYMTGK